ncbi:hypothetical protein ES703_23261 [subsurface metagenome]
MKRKISSFIFALLLVLSFSLMAAPVAVSANPGGMEFVTSGDATAEWSTEKAYAGDYSVKLYAASYQAGDAAAVSIPFGAIQFDQITELSYWKYIESFEDAQWGFNPLVILGIDANGDGVLDFDIEDALLYSNEANPQLGDDAILVIESTTGIAPYLTEPDTDWGEVDVLVGDPLHPRHPGNEGYPLVMIGFDKNGWLGEVYHWADFVGFGPIDTTDNVKLVVLALDCPSNQTVYVDDVTINGVLYELEPATAVSIDLTVDSAIVDPDGVATFTVTALDQYGNETGIDVTDTSEFSIGAAAGGSWSDEAPFGVYTSDGIGVWTVTATYETLTDTTTLTVQGMELDEAFYDTSDTVNVTVVCAAANGDPMATEEITIAAASATDITGDDDIVLTEDGFDSAVFTGSFTLIPAPPADRELDQIVVSDAGDITATYNGYDAFADVDESAPEFISVTADTDFYKNEDTITLAVVLDDPGYTVTVDFSTIDSGYTTGSEDVVGYDVTYEISATNTVADGVCTVSVTAEDAAGNTTIDSTCTISLDNTAPTLSDEAATPGQIQPGEATDVEFTVTVSDGTGAGIDSVTIDLSSIDGSATEAMTGLAGVYTYTYEDLTITEEDDYAFPVTATDARGNVNEETTLTLTVVADIAAPVISDPAITYPFELSSARPDDKVTITVTVIDDIAMGTVTADSDVFTDEIPLIAGAGDTYTGTATIAGDALRGEYTVTINATDAATNPADPDTSLEVSVRAGATGWEIELEEGWNLISLPLIPENTDIEAMTTSLTECQKIRRYVPGATPPDDWLVYNYGFLGASSLLKMEDGYGYWVKMDADGSFTFSGWELVAATDPPSVPPSYDMVEGWNLIGFKSTTSSGIAAYLGGVAGTLDAIYGYRDGAFFMPAELEPGLGYWIAVTEPGTIYP